MKRVRIKFDADIVIEGEDMAEVVSNWLNLPLFTNEAVEHGVEFGEVFLVEDAETYDDLMGEFNKSF